MSKAASELRVAPGRAHEMRYDEGSRRRVFTVSNRHYKSAGLYTVRTGWDNAGMNTEKFLRIFGTTLTLSSELKGERWYEDQTEEDVRRRLRRWRAACAKAGLTKVIKWKDTL